MIRFVDRYSCNTELLPWETFSCLDTETNMLMDNVLEGENYYVYHNGKDTDRYKRVIALSFVDVCQTDEEDDLSMFGFELFGHLPNRRNWWRRIRRN